jgi:hypothetical protein
MDYDEAIEYVLEFMDRNVKVDLREYLANIFALDALILNEDRHFNNFGLMHTNWLEYKGERYYLIPDKDGWRGRMATGWKYIGSKWYYFETKPGSEQGKMYRASVTPDGYTVDADGVWNGVGATPVGQE